MASRQSASKSARPVTASPTSKPPTSKPQQTKPAQAPKASATPSAAAADTRPAPGNGAAARKQALSQQATVAGKPTVGTQPASGVRAVPGALASALRVVVNWCGGGLPFAAILFTVLGFADSIYLTYQHYTESTSFAGCSEHGAINCVAVTTSAWSHIPAGPSGIPVSVAGLAFYVFMLAINSRWAWRAPWAVVHWARLASVIVGIVFVLYLVWAELFRINAICLYCTGVHIITFILFVLIISRFVMSGVRGTGTTDNG
jgi:uncharacterized membrane protein